MLRDGRATTVVIFNLIEKGWEWWDGVLSAKVTIEIFGRTVTHLTHLMHLTDMRLMGIHFMGMTSWAYTSQACTSQAGIS